MDKIILYTTHCPKCKILETKLYSKNIIYQENTNIEEMLKKGFVEVPVLVVNEKTMNFKEANNWINNYNKRGVIDGN